MSRLLSRPGLTGALPALPGFPPLRTGIARRAADLFAGHVQLVLANDQPVDAEKFRMVPQKVVVCVGKKKHENYENIH